MTGDKNEIDNLIDTMIKNGDELVNNLKTVLPNSLSESMIMFHESNVENLKKIKTDISETFILKKINDRSIAKQKGDFSLADQIRNELLSKGVVIEDQKDKTIWKLK